MSTVMPILLRACSRTGARIIVSGALAIGLLTSAPVADAHAVSTEKVAHHPKHPHTHQHHSKHHHKHKHKHKHKQTKAQRHHRQTVARVGRAVRTAVAQKGDPYSYGASGPGSFDCSGLTYYSFRRAGFGGIPRTSSAQAGYARHIPRSAMRRGDLIFFTGGGGVYHVGVFAGWYRGHRTVLHAPYSGTRVRTDALWTNAWFPGTLRYR